MKILDSPLEGHSILIERRLLAPLPCYYITTWVALECGCCLFLPGYFANMFSTVARHVGSSVTQITTSLLFAQYYSMQLGGVHRDGKVCYIVDSKHDYNSTIASRVYIKIHHTPSHSFATPADDILNLLVAAVTQFRAKNQQG